MIRYLIWISFSIGNRPVGDHMSKCLNEMNPWLSFSYVGLEIETGSAAAEYGIILGNLS